MEMQPATVHVVDDDSAARSSLKLMLKSVGLPVNTFESAEEFLMSHAKCAAGCALLDVRMPGMSAAALQRELILRGSLLPVIFLTGHADVSMAVRAMQQGAFDFVERPFHEQRLLERVHCALQHNAEERSHLSDLRTIRKRLQLLTPREREVLDHVTRGSSNEVAAHDLRISRRTVEIYRARVMEKMHAPSLAHLVRMTRTLAAH